MSLLFYQIREFGNLKLNLKVLLKLSSVILVNIWLHLVLLPTIKLLLKFLTLRMETFRLFLVVTMTWFMIFAGVKMIDFLLQPLLMGLSRYGIWRTKRPITLTNSITSITMISSSLLNFFTHHLSMVLKFIHTKTRRTSLLPPSASIKR